MKFDPMGELARLQSDRSQYHVQPLVARKSAAPAGVMVKVEAAELDRPQVFNVEGVIIVLDFIVDNGDLGPDATFQQTVGVLIKLMAYCDALRVEILQGRPVSLLLLDVTDVHFIYEPVLALGGDFRLGGVGFI